MLAKVWAFGRTRATAPPAWSCNAAASGADIRAYLSSGQFRGQRDTALCPGHHERGATVRGDRYFLWIFPPLRASGRMAPGVQ